MADYDSVAKMYLDRRNDKKRFDWNRDIEVPAIIKSIGNVKNKTLLDMGCGFGDHAQKLSKTNFKKLVGFDISPALIEFANNQNIPKTTFYVGDMGKKLKENSSTYDLVYSSLAIHYISNLKKLFSEVHRVLKNKGVFCFTTQHPIFAMINQNAENMIKIVKHKNGKRTFYGDYFDESAKITNLGRLGIFKTHNYAHETIIMTALRANFDLIEYRDLKPTPSKKKIDSKKYKTTTTHPSFILFKFKKK